MLIWEKKQRRFRCDMEVMRSIIALDPELDSERSEFWIARIRAGGLRRVAITLLKMAGIGLAIGSFVLLVLRLAKLG